MHQKELIQVIKNRREVLRITQDSLSELSGVSLRTLKAFESGKGNPTVTTLGKLADVLGLTLKLDIKLIS